jgi:hypothetical protein
MIQAKDRETTLKIGAGVAVGLLLLYYVIIDPSLEAWKTREERIATMSEKVNRGENLIKREAALRKRWAEMQRTDLSEDSSEAADSMIKALGRWTNVIGRNFTSLNATTGNWRAHDEGYDTYEWRGTVSGDQATLGRLLYEIEADPLPARVEDCEISTRDANGQQLTLAVRFTFLRLNDSANGNNNSGGTTAR